MNQLQLIFATISLICILYTLRDVTMWITGRHNRSAEFVDLFDKRIMKLKVLTRKSVTAALRQSINEFTKAN